MQMASIGSAATLLAGRIAYHAGTLALARLVSLMA